jgi:hypothetical protein
MKSIIKISSGIIFLACIMLFMHSCDRKVRGCTDPDSINFDELAEKDDGSCEYEGEAVIWYNQAASAGLVGDGATALTFYINGEVAGSSAASVYWSGKPDCGANGTITVTEYLGHSRAKTFTLSVKDQDGFEYWNVRFDIEANTCLALELTWQMRKKKAVQGMAD